MNTFVGNSSESRESTLANNQVAINSEITADWNNGFTADVSFTNQGDYFKDWVITFQSNAEIEKFWNTELVSRNGNRYTVKAVHWNDDVSAGETITFGFKAKGDDAVKPFNYRFNDQNIGGRSQSNTSATRETTSDNTPNQSSSNAISQSTESEPANNQVEINSEITADWNNGFTADVSFTNQGSDLNDWVITFESDAEIEKFWNTELVSRNGNQYTVKAVHWNDDVSTGETITFGFKAKGDDAVKPFNYRFNDQNIGGRDEPNPPVTRETTSDNTPNQPSSNAISQGFEGHGNNTAYDYIAQKKDWNLLWTENNQMSRFAKITNSEAFEGNNSLRVTYSPNEWSRGGSAAWQIPEKKEYYLSYRVKFEAGFDFNGRKFSGGKLPGLSSSDGQLSGGQTGNGSNGFTTRYMWRENGQAEAYVYHMDKPSQWGDSFEFKDISGGDVYFETGKWHKITQRVKINDGNQKNGSMDVWMDGEQVLDLDNLRFVTNGSGIDVVYFSTFQGGSNTDWAADQFQHAYFDDFVVSTNPADVGV